MSRSIGRYGWIPDLPDARDQIYMAPRMKTGVMPVSADLRALCPPFTIRETSEAARRTRSGEPSSSIS